MADEELPGDSEKPEEAEKPEDAATSEEGEASASASGEDTSEDEKPKPKKYGGGFQKRISELTAKLRESQGQNERLMELIERSKTDPQDEQPQRDKFEDYESYLEARARWAARQEARTVEKRLAEDFDKRTARQAQAQVESEWQSRQEEARRRYEDFDEVAFANDLPITDGMAEAIKLAENGPEIAYYLGKNPGEAERISELTGAKAIIEIGRIEERLLARAKRSGAPPPVSPVKSKASGNPDPLSDKASIDKWMAERRKHLKR